MRKLPSIIKYCLAPLVFTLGSTLWALQRVNLDDVPHYWYSAFASAVFVTLPGSIAFALVAAIIAANKRQAKPFLKVSRRAAWQIIIRDLAYPFFAFLVSYIVLLGYLATKVGKASDSPPLLIALVVPVVASAVLSFGYWCGLVFPKAIAIVLSLVTPITWAGFTVASQSFALHYATGLLFADCCRIYTVIDNQALLLSISLNLSFAVVIFGLCLRSLSGSRNKHRNAYALTSFGIITMFVSFATFGSHVGATPITDRNVEALVCEGKAPEICLFPQQSQSPSIERAMNTSWNNLREIYPDIPKRVVGSIGGAGLIGVVVTVHSTSDEVAYSLSADAIGSPTYCEETQSQAALRDSSYRILQNLFLTQASSNDVNLDGFKLPLNKNESFELSKIAVAPTSVKQVWVKRALSSVADCSTKPALE